MCRMLEWLGGLRRAQLGVASAGFAFAGLVAGGANAQTPDFSMAGLLGSEVQLAVGGIAVVSPRYEGSKQYKVMGAPFVVPGGPETDKDRVKFRGADDIRLRLFDLQNLEIGALTGWRFGREEDDGDRLAGMGDISGGLILGGYAAYHVGPLTPFVSYHHQVTGNDTGGVLRFGAEAKVQVMPGVKITGVAAGTWADSNYMQSFFGVSATQALTSKLTAFDAGAGIKDAFVELGTEFQLDRSWKLKVAGRYTRLLGDAESSPVTETADQFSGMVMLSYDFRLPLP